LHDLLYSLLFQGQPLFPFLVWIFVVKLAQIRLNLQSKLNYYEVSR